MSEWRRRALEALPELREEIEAAPSVMALWIELHLALEQAYRSPESEDAIRRIYGLALKTLRDSRNRAAATAVVVAFFEHLSTDRAVREDMHRWIPPEVFHTLEEPLGYFLDEAECGILRQEYRKRYSDWMGGRRGPGGSRGRRTRPSTR